VSRRQRQVFLFGLSAPRESKKRLEVRKRVSWKIQAYGVHGMEM
jgi:hypothetical protein